MEIKYPKDYSEAEIKSILWDKLKELGIGARLEVVVNGGQSVPKFYSCRLDMVVFRDETPVCIVECKPRSAGLMTGQELRRREAQLEKYKRLFNLPIFTCDNIIAVNKVVHQVKEIYDKAS